MKNTDWRLINDGTLRMGDHFTILVFGSYTRDCPQKATEVHYYKKGKFFEFRNMDGSRTKNITHWMPMPPDPIKNA